MPKQKSEGTNECRSIALNSRQIWAIYLHISCFIFRGSAAAEQLEAAEPRCPGGQLTHIFSGVGPHMALDPSLFVAFTCAQSVAVVNHSFIQLLLFNSPQIIIVLKDLKLKSNNSIHIHNNLLT